jgi:tetratricopeptide (TPR) repeat protein
VRRTEGGGRVPTGPRLLFACATLAAAALVAAAYSNHFDNAFHFDDEHVIVDNLAIRNLSGWPSFFTDATTYTARPQNASYRPLLTLSYALDYRRGGGLVPRAFHGTQFALLLALGAGLVALYTTLARVAQPGSKSHAWVALAAATLFCVHTANTQTVNYLSARSTLVATLGVVGALLVWTAWPRGRLTGAYLVPMVLGALAKPEALVFAPILALWVLFFEEDVSLEEAWGGKRRAALRAARRTLPAFVLAIGLYAFLRGMEPSSMVYSNLDPLTYARSQPFAWLHYARLFLWPSGLTADTDWRPVEGWQDPRFLAGALFLTGLAVSIVALSRARRLRPLAFALAWFALGLVPSSSFFPLSEVCNEHRLFLPFAGLAFGAVWAVAAALGSRFPARRPAAIAVLAGVLVVLLVHAAATHRRNRVWRDDLALWTDVVAKSPANARGLMNLGVANMARARLDRAIELFLEARELEGNYPILEINLALALAARGRDEEARGGFERALALDPDYAQGHTHYARWLARAGRGPEAVAHAERAVGLSPADANARALLTQLLDVKGDAGRLATLARRTLELDPADPFALAATRPGPIGERSGLAAARHGAMGRRLIEQGLWLDGAQLTRRAVELAPEDAVAWNQLGWALAHLGFWHEATAAFERALAADPTLEVARANLAWAGSRARSAAAPQPD